jgi:ABC-type polysaccharide/polyol phosphate transport system ATPase subunit/ABC-type polysaccharide/polyol phosphate export permease
VSAQHVSKAFRVPHEHYLTVKERVVHPFSHWRARETLQALRDVSFDIKAGEFFGVVGKNGSGKSTLLRCISGIYPVDDGQIAVEGNLAPFIELGVGFNPEMTVRDNVLANTVLLGMTRRQARERLDDILGFAELERFGDMKLRNCSSGMNARLGFSVTVQVDAQVLLFDEVLAVGDSSFKQKCLERFQQLKEEGRTIVLVTHSMEWVEDFCDRALLLDRGEVVQVGEPKAVAAAYEELNKEGGVGVAQPGDVHRPAPSKRGRTTRTSRQGPLPARIRRFARIVGTLGLTEFRLRYMDSVLSYFWAVARPFAFFGVLYLVFTRVANFDSGVPHYPLYLLMALVLWTFFSESTGTATLSMVRYAGLLRTLPIPRLAVPLSVTLTSLLDLCMTMVAVFGFLLLGGVHPHVGWLQIPLLVGFVATMVAGVSLLLSALFVRYRDVDQIWQVVRQTLFYGSPIFYVAASLPDSVRAPLMCNPLAATYTQMRHAVIDPTAPSLSQVIGGGFRPLAPVAIVAGLFALGLWTFQRRSADAAENV